MQKYTWEAYDINDEIVGGGNIYAIDEDAAGRVALEKAKEYGKI